MFHDFLINSSIHMKQISIIFLQAVILIIGLIVLFILIRFPLTEGRAQHLDLFRIYFDPFILYGYVSSIAFFVALYKAIKLLGYIGKNHLFSLESVKTLRSIKYCSIIIAISIALAGIYIKLFHHKDDDPAGFLAMCIIFIFISIAIGTAVAVFEKSLQNAIDIKTENDLTI